MTRRAVIAVGGNALIKDPRHQTVEDQYMALGETAHYIADLIEYGWEVAIGHGNGPQVGFVLRRSEIAYKVEGLHQVPLDVCGANTQGAIGYELGQNLANEFKRRGIHKHVATIITQVVVDRDDPAFTHPSKPIGGFMDEAEARRRMQSDGWTVMEDAGRGWRRVVASPAPKRIVELEAIQTLLRAGIVVICAGGGGIPVVEDEQGYLHGAAAVIDKDHGASLLARSIGAEVFLIATSVEKVYLNFGKPDQKPISLLTAAEARQYIQEGHFAPGSMLPKVEAALQFLEAGGKQAIITNPENIARAIRGETGTHVTL